MESRPTSISVASTCSDRCSSLLRDNVSPEPCLLPGCVAGVYQEVPGGARVCVATLPLEQRARRLCRGRRYAGARDAQSAFCT
eukprot:3177395-Pyramimonas_sp.AAC.1